MENIKIDTTDIILMDLATNSGKIIISDTSWGYTFSYQWNAMSGTLKEFLCKINDEYFTKNLTTARHEVFNSKKTMREVRRWLRNDCELKWYQHTDFWKHIRYELNSIESSAENSDEFCQQMGRLRESLPYWRFERKWEVEDVQEKLSYLSDEPWQFLVEDVPHQNIWLAKLHGKLKEVLISENVHA